MQSAQEGKYKVDKKGSQGEHIYLTPLEKHTHTLIWMHGLGDTGAGYEQGFREEKVIPDYFKIVLLTAPIRAVTINFGMKMTSWFDFKDFDIRPDNIEKAISAEEVKESARMINYVLEEEISLLDGKSKNVFIGGFSQGAAMAVHVGIQFPQKLGGIAAFSGFKFPFSQINEKNLSSPILISHGTSDPLLVWNKCEASYSEIKNTCTGVEWDIQKGLQHGFSQQSWDKFNQFLVKNSQ